MDGVWVGSYGRGHIRPVALKLTVNGMNPGATVVGELAEVALPPVFIIVGIGVARTPGDDHSDGVEGDDAGRGGVEVRDGRTGSNVKRCIEGGSGLHGKQGTTEEKKKSDEQKGRISREERGMWHVSHNPTNVIRQQVFEPTHLGEDGDRCMLGTSFTTLGGCCCCCVTMVWGFAWVMGAGPQGRNIEGASVSDGSSRSEKVGVCGGVGMLLLLTDDPPLIAVGGGVGGSSG